MTNMTTVPVKCSLHGKLWANVNLKLTNMVCSIQQNGDMYQSGKQYMCSDHTITQTQ